MRLVQESTITDTVVDTLVGLTEEELVSANVTRLDPCCCCVAAFTVNDVLYGITSACDAEESALKVSSSDWSRSLRGS